jgi:fungal nitric oxide reductase
VFSDPDPDTFDMYRKFDPVDGLGFGYGAHRCVAEYLAKTELEIVFGEYGTDMMEASIHTWTWTDTVVFYFVATLFRKYPELKVAVAFEDIKYTNPHMDIGILELPVVC